MLLLPRTASRQPYTQQTSQILRLSNVSNSFSAPKLIFSLSILERQSPLRREIPKGTFRTTCRSVSGVSADRGYKLQLCRFLTTVEFSTRSLSSSRHEFLTAPGISRMPTASWEMWGCHLFIYEWSSWCSRFCTSCRVFLTGNVLPTWLVERPLSWYFLVSPMPTLAQLWLNASNGLSEWGLQPVWKLPWDEDPLMDSWLTSWLSLAAPGRLKGHGTRGTLAAINLLLPLLLPFSFTQTDSSKDICNASFQRSWLQS